MKTKIKIFNALEIEVLETRVQQWLDENQDIQIQFISQSDYKHNITISIYYI